MIDLFSYCQTILQNAESISALPLTLFIMAFLGGFAHCSFMCGPFVVMQQMTRLEGTPVQNMSEFKRLQGIALLPYHAGRITTYTFLGVLSCLLGQWAQQAWAGFMGYVLIIAGVLFLFAVFKIKLFNAPFIAPVLAKFSAPFSKDPTGGKGYVYGLILGFLPCAMVYAALAAVAGVGNVYMAIVSMFLFGVGTVPALLMVGFLAHLGKETLMLKIKKISKFGMALAACWLIVTGVLHTPFGASLSHHFF